MKKRKWGVLLATVLVVGIVTGVVATDLVHDIKAQLRADFTVVIDGDEKEFKNVNGERVYPILYEGTTYLPVRAIGEIMEKTVYWYEDDKRIELKNNYSTVTDADVIVTDVKPDEIVQKNEEKNKDKNKETVSADGIIKKEKAKEIALKKANFKLSDVTFIKAELDKENGVYVYDVEFKKGNKEYSAEIKADDGKILDWEVDLDD